MAMKEKISLSRDRMIQKISESKADEFEKTELTNILIDAADGTNGLSKEDKLQNVSETVFALAKLDAQGALDRIESAERDKELKASISSLSDKVDKVVTTLSTVSIQLKKNDEATLALKTEFDDVKKIQRTKMEIFFNGLDRIFKGGKWYWALSAVIVLVAFIFKSDIIALIKHVFN